MPRTSRGTIMDWLGSQSNVICGFVLVPPKRCCYSSRPRRGTGRVESRVAGLTLQLPVQKIKQKGEELAGGAAAIHGFNTWGSTGHSEAKIPVCFFPSLIAHGDHAWVWGWLL